MSLYGLVISGGQSSRMGTDKSTLVYYEKPQHDHVADLLAPLCEQVIISCNAYQLHTLQSDYQKLPDLPQFDDSGPIAALLTAFSAFPNHNLLVAGCDYPYLTTEDLSIFLKYIDKDSPAAAFYNRDGMYEPLLAWYSASAAPDLRAHFNSGARSIQHFLKERRAGKYVPASEKVMTSVDTPEDFRAVKQLLAHENNR